MALLRFIHCADLHLDRPFQGIQDVPDQIAERIRESTFRSLARIVDAAIEEPVDFVIMAGDLFDDEQRSLRAQARLRAQMQRLADQQIEVFAVHGNHDPLNHHHVSVHWPENVHIFNPGSVEAIPFVKNQEVLAYLYGFSYPQRAVTERMSRFYEKKAGARYHIGILHGNHEGSQEHDPYAPFTVAELLEADFDYWALGHIHKRQWLHEDPPIVYPGNIQGLNRKETGEKGFTHIEIDHDDKAHISFIPTADVTWHTIEIAISDKLKVEQLLRACDEAIESLRADKTGVLLAITLTGAGPLHSYLQEQENIDDLLLTLREDESEKENFVWPVACYLQTSLPIDREKLKGEGHFPGDLIRLIDEEGFSDEALDPLYQNRRTKKFLAPVSAREKENLLKEAEQLLLAKLMPGRSE